MILKGIHGNVDTCQTNYTVHSKLRIFPLFLIHTWKCNIQAITIDLKRLKQNNHLFNLIFLFFLSFSSFQCHNQKWCMLSFTCIKLVAHVLACAHEIARIKWRRLYILFQLFNIYFQFPYLHAFYKLNNIKTKPSTKV